MPASITVNQGQTQSFSIQPTQDNGSTVNLKVGSSSGSGTTDAVLTYDDSFKRFLAKHQWVQKPINGSFSGDRFCPFLAPLCISDGSFSATLNYYIASTDAESMIALIQKLLGYAIDQLNQDGPYTIFKTTIWGINIEIDVTKVDLNASTVTLGLISVIDPPDGTSATYRVILDVPSATLETSAGNIAVGPGAVMADLTLSQSGKAQLNALQFSMRGDLDYEGFNIGGYVVAGSLNMPSINQEIVSKINAVLGGLVAGGVAANDLAVLIQQSVNAV